MNNVVKLSGYRCELCANFVFFVVKNLFQNGLNSYIYFLTNRYNDNAPKAVLPSAEELQNELLNFEQEHGRK